MTYLATVVGGGDVFYEPAVIIKDTIAPVIVLVGVFIAQLIRARYMADKIFPRFQNCYTVGNILRDIYGENVQIFTGILSVIHSAALVALQMCSFGIVASNLLGIDTSLGIIVSGIMLIFYSAFGGIKSVTATDIFQLICLVSVLSILSFITVQKIGGLEELIRLTPSEKFDLKNSSILPMYISIFCLDVIFSAEFFEPARMQRMLMTKSSQILKNVFYVTAPGNLLIFILIIVFSLAAYILCPNVPADQVVSYLFHNEIPHIFQPFLIVGLLFILMSSADSHMNSAGVSMAIDVVEPSMKKILNKNVNALTVAKLTTMISGLLSILFALKYQKIFQLDNLLSISAPVMAAPLLFGILNMRISRKSFWWSSIAGVVSLFILNNLLQDYYKPYSVLIATFISAFVFLMFNAFAFSKIEFIEEENIASKNFRLKSKNLIKYIFEDVFLIFGTFTRKMVKIYGQNYNVFGITQLILLLTPSFLWNGVDLGTSASVMKSIGIVLSSLLLTHSIWPSALKKYRPSFWYITLTYCLPFLSTIMLILSHGAIEYTINIAINIMFLLLLVDWASAIGIGIVGASAAIGYYKFFIQIDPIETIFGFETKYLLIYQIIFGTIIGLLFARKKHIRIKSLDENTDFLEELQQNIIETNNMSIAIADDANITPENINLHPAENLEAVKILLQEKNLLSSEMSQKLAELEIFIAAEEKNISPYMVLNADKVDLLKISQKFESFSKACACENTYVSIYTKEKTVKWDSSQMIKCIGKLAQNYHKKMKDFYDEDSDIFLNISISDEKIKYISATDPTISREMSAIGIILSENENFYSTLKNKVFEKVMTDPEKIPSTRLKDHKMIDIERTIDAHYGVLQTIEDEESLSYICVLPINVYDIRPITLDMNAPDVDQLSYNWPAAEKLEAEFWEKASSINTISKNKIEKAIDYIKIYHRHQTRKSGEPYYLHPMSVAMIAIDIAKEDSEIHDFLMENIETIILVSLLHDILEDTYIKHKNILQNFGGEVLRYIESVTKTDFKQREFLLSNDQAFTKLINQEPITICVKIADRIHNLYTIDGHPKIEKRKAVAEETMMFFTRAAKKYGMEKLAAKLTSMCNYIIEKGKIGDLNL